MAPPKFYDQKHISSKPKTSRRKTYFTDTETTSNGFVDFEPEPDPEFSIDHDLQTVMAFQSNFRRPPPRLPAQQWPQLDDESQRAWAQLFIAAKRIILGDQSSAPSGSSCQPGNPRKNGYTSITYDDPDPLPPEFRVFETQRRPFVLFVPEPPIVFDIESAPLVPTKPTRAPETNSKHGKSSRSSGKDNSRTNTRPLPRIDHEDPPDSNGNTVYKNPSSAVKSRERDWK